MSSGMRAALVALVVAVAFGAFLTTRAAPVPPFGVESAAPDGFGALSILLSDRGVEVSSAIAGDVLSGSLEAGPGDAIVVAVPALATDAELDRIEAMASDGATIVLGEPRPSDDEGDVGDMDLTVIDQLSFLGGRTLIDEPADPIDPGDCDISELQGLGPIDAAFSVGMEIGSERRCYADLSGAQFLWRQVGGGSVVTMASPLLWVNARLQPNKEDGGEPLANGPTALRLLGDADSVVFIDAVQSPGAPIDGSQDPLTLLPLPVKLALVQLLAAFVLFVWWRSRRLGSAVTERLPVEIAGSELVVAVGELLRRRANAGRAATTVREETRRVLGERLGMGPHADPRAMVEVVAARTGRPPDQVGAALYGDPAAPVNSSEALVQLSRTLDSIRQEVLSVHSPR